MRVRMKTTEQVPTRDAENGDLTLVFPAGSTQFFDDATVAALGDKVEKIPEESSRVRMQRTLTEPELAVIAGTSVAPGTEGQRYMKGDLVHFPNDVAAALIASEAAKAEPDPAYRPVEAARRDAVARAVAVKREKEEREQRIAEAKRIADRATRAADVPESDVVVDGADLTTISED